MFLIREIDQDLATFKGTTRLKPRSKRDCDRGFSCKASCIARGKNCRVRLNGQPTLIAEWLQAVTARRGRRAAGTSERVRPQAGTQGQPKQNWMSRDYLFGLVKSSIPGAGKPDLARAMRELGTLSQKSDRDPEDLLKLLSKVRVRPIKELRVEYERFLELKKQAAQTPPPIEDLLPIHNRFTGSRSQLRSGKVVGDALGIDPVFGALLNPTGGIVGPGNQGFDGGDSPLGYHAAVHDACGYLYKYHRIGNGYNYLNEEKRDPANPLSGQVSGIRFWREHLQGGASDRAAQWIMAGIVTTSEASVDLARNLRARLAKPIQRG